MKKRKNRYPLWTGSGAVAASVVIFTIAGCEETNTLTLGDAGPLPNDVRDVAVLPDTSTADGAAMPGDEPVPGTDAETIPGPVNCKPLAIENAVSVGGYISDRFSFYDAACKLRTAALVRNNAADPGGSRGGYLREFTYDVNGTARKIVGTGVNGWNGWGYVVMHYASSADVSRGKTGTFATVFAGKHHAIHQFKVRMTPGGPVDVTLQWVFATGHSNPLIAMTFDATPAGPNGVSADTRTPYGELAWDGNANGAVEGIAWGDKYQFTTTGNPPVTMNSTWDYSKANIVPYVTEWSSSADAEMGAVQTQSWETQLAGGDYGGGAITTQCWGKTSATKGPQCSSNGNAMPTDYLWPFQLNQYELPSTSASKRLAWGATYGAVGQSSVNAFGKTVSGYPQKSYSVYAILGTHSTNVVREQITEVEHQVAAQIRATKGTVVESGPGGIARTDSVAYSPHGYNATYGAWEIRADSGEATFALNCAGGAVHTPLFLIREYEKASPVVSLNGSTLTEDVDYFASVDSATKTLWVTLNRTVASTAAIGIK